VVADYIYRTCGIAVAFIVVSWFSGTTIDAWYLLSLVGGLAFGQLLIQLFSWSRRKETS